MTILFKFGLDIFINLNARCTEDARRRSRRSLVISVFDVEDEEKEREQNADERDRAHRRQQVAAYVFHLFLDERRVFWRNPACKRSPSRRLTAGDWRRANRRRRETRRCAARRRSGRASRRRPRATDRR